ncbi:MAG: prolipoprotein diacylglyceryl transferase [Deltaproteobacteria bacterium]|jgi:phosphatidylglycerol:prolipoprotein diacylglycerol transferase|nr:prolipoprotein diacylglyceryl transferase [Deltaproteobacteria bacterium]
MNPVLLRFSLPLLGEITFPAYFTALALAFLVGLILLERAARKLNINPLRLYDMGVLIILVSLLGARLLHVVADGQFTDYVNLCVDPVKVEVPVGPGGPDVAKCFSDAQCGSGFLCDKTSSRCYPQRDCFAAVKVWRGGLVFYGGFIFAMLFAFFWIKKFRLPKWKITDIFGYILPFGLAITRGIGCMLNGCCYGKPTSLPWGVRYAPGLGPYDDQVKSGLIVKGAEYSLAVHPTQLYHAFLNFIIFLLAYYYLRSRKKFDGQIFAFFLMGYAIQRFIVEFFRSDPRGNVLFFSTSQFISIFIFIFGIWIWKYRAAKSLEYFENTNKDEENK